MKKHKLQVSFEFLEDDFTPGIQGVGARVFEREPTKHQRSGYRNLVDLVRIDIDDDSPAGVAKALWELADKLDAVSGEGGE